MSPREESIRAFVFALFTADGRELAAFRVPVSVAAPFANRLYNELLDLPDWRSAVREPWYLLSAIDADDPPLPRPEQPEGLTSLFGQRYDPAEEGPPELALHPEARVRGFLVLLLDNDRELFRGAFSVDDLFLHAGRFLLRQHVLPGETVAGERYTYAVMPTSEPADEVPDDLLPASAYDVEGVFRLPPRTRPEPRIRFRRVPEPPLPECRPALGPLRSLGRGTPQAGRVVLPRPIYEQLHRRLPLSHEREEGGYLLGEVSRLAGCPADESDPAFGWVVTVTELLRAEEAVGSAARLLFTGDSWSKVGRRRQAAARRLVGWFHVHLFPANDSFGLSGMDQEMHAWYLPRPWQIAVLLNLEADGGRTVRCFQRGPEHDLVETPFEVCEGGIGERSDNSQS